MDQRVAAYCVIVEPTGRGVLLAHWREGDISSWTLPGGGLEPGERPVDAAVREVEEETGYVVELDGLLDADSHVIPAARRIDRGATSDLHAIRIVYRAHVVGGDLRDEVGGTTDTAGWFDLTAIGDLDRTSLVDLALELAVPPI